MISVDVADNCEIRDILNALIDTLCCTNNAAAISIGKSECTLCEENLSGSELEQITPEKNTEESSGIIVLETDKNEDNISCHSDEMRNEPISKNQNKEDDVVDARSELDHLKEKSFLDIVSKNPFGDGDDASSHSPSALCPTGNPFDDTSISPNPPIAIKAKSFIIRSQPPQANAIPNNVGQQRYKPTTASTSTGSKSAGSKSAKNIDAPSYPKTLFAARPDKVGIPSLSSSSSSSSPSMSSSSHRPSVSVAASSPLRRTSIAFVAPAECIPEVSPTVLT